MQQFSREISYDRLAQKAGVSSTHTMQTYTGYLAEAFLVSLVRRYSAKPAERIRNEKLYVSDPAFISYFTGVLGSDEELGWRLENIVYLELLRRRTDDDAEIYYYKDQTNDIDFCRVRHGKIVQLIQVAYTIEGLKTRRREVAPLFSAARKTGCGNLLLVTDHERETISQDGFTIEVMPAREWLLAK
jgi:predicted AAA+ superfamily ATPase